MEKIPNFEDKYECEFMDNESDIPYCKLHKCRCLVPDSCNEMNY